MRLDVFMDSWIIGDGNYSDFSKGETRQFALELWAPAGLKKIEGSEKSSQADQRYTYAISAEVMFASSEILVIDSGVLAYSATSSDLEAGFRVGDFVKGDVTFGVDPFFYFERLSKLPDVPALIYEWRIEWVEQETTPLISGKVCGREGYVRDQARTRFERVESTSEIIPNPHDIAPSYVLHCTKLEAAAMKTFSRPQR